MVTTGQMKDAKIKSTEEFHFESLPKATLAALQKCAQIDFFSRGKWYLAGGTALALQAGHRQSVDLDFFAERENFDEKKLEKLLSKEGKWMTTSLSEGTLYGEFFGAKMSFIAYPYFRPARPLRKYGTISILTPPDIAVMKITAISQRGRKRDFFDLYWLCRNTQPLAEIVSKVGPQYSVHQNPAHILKSLVYFEDAEKDPEPFVFFKADWPVVKKFFRKEIPAIAKKLMRLE